MGITSIARWNLSPVIFGVDTQRDKQGSAGLCPRAFFQGSKNSGSEKGVFWKRGLFRKVHFLEILENLEILELLENPQTVEDKGEFDHFLEILENLEILEILEIPPVKRPLS